ncbi:hypothetical protein SUDANB176_07673 (plasmid) [Streptomyces sp. enrichment culture]
MPRPILVLGSPGPAHYSEFTLTQITSSHPLLLLNASAPSWIRPHLAGHIEADPADLLEAACAVQNHAARHDLSGVLTFHSQYLDAASGIARLLNLPSAPSETLVASTDRVVLRRLLEQHHVPVSRWSQADDPDMAAYQSDRLGYPVTFSLRSGTDFQPIHVRSRSEVPSAFDRTSHASDTRSQQVGARGVFIEQDSEEPRVSAETVVLHEDIRIAAITHTLFGPPPARPPVRHIVHAHDPLLHNPVLRRIVARTVRALRITHGVVHITMRLTSRGPRVTEVAAHLPGDLIPLLVKKASGIDLAQAAAEIAIGKTPTLTPTLHRAAAIRFVYSDRGGRVEGLQVRQTTNDPLVERCVLTQQPGAQIRPLPLAGVEDRLAHWVVLGSNKASCLSALDQAVQRIRIALSHGVEHPHAA